MPRLARAAAIAVLLSLATTSFGAFAQTESTAAQPLAFLEPFMGVWLPHPDWEPLEKNPELGSLVPLNLQWNAGRSSMRIEEGLRFGGGYDATGTLLWNPVSARAEFLVRQSGGDLVFDGHYEPVDAKTVRRVYDVIGPKGDVRVFRETMHLRDDDVMDWTTELQVDGVFKHVRGGSGPEFHAVRPSTEPASALQDFAQLIGDWRPDPERIPPGLAEWRKRNNVSDGYASFQWGTAKRWIEFGEHRNQDSEWRLEGSGILAWDPRSRMVVYREHTDSGVTLEGTLERVDPLTVLRHYRAALPDGSVQEWEDKWRWKSGEDGCFEWTTTRVGSAERQARQPYWVCRKAAPTGSGTPTWAQDHMASQLGHWVADNGAYKSSAEPFDAYGLHWEWAPGRKSLTGRLFVIEDGDDGGTLWQYRMIWHPQDQTLRVYQYGTDGTIVEGALTLDDQGETRLLQTLFTPAGTTAIVGHRERLDGNLRHVSSFAVDAEGEWHPDRSYVFQLQD